MNYLLDTDIIIDFLKGKKETIEKLKELFGEGIGISVISLGEYLVGAYKVSQTRRIIKVFEQFIKENEIEILPIDEEIARIYARNQAGLEKRGEKIGGFDMFIAATCLKHRLKLVTGNYRHFSRISRFDVLS